MDTAHFLSLTVNGDLSFSFFFFLAIMKMLLWNTMFSFLLCIHLRGIAGHLACSSMFNLFRNF